MPKPYLILSYHLIIWSPTNHKVQENWVSSNFNRKEGIQTNYEMNK